MVQNQQIYQNVPFVSCFSEFKLIFNFYAWKRNDDIKSPNDSFNNQQQQHYIERNDGLLEILKKIKKKILLN